MKTLKQYLNESLFDVKQYIVNELNGDFDMALNILKNGNSISGLLQGVNDFVTSKNNPLKNAGYYLSMLFNLSGLPVNKSKRNQFIIKSIINDNDVDDLNKMIGKLIKNDEKISLKLIEKRGNLTKLSFCEDYKKLANYIYDIEFFEKNNNSSANGKGELLLSLLFGDKLNNSKGDVKSKNMSFEVKSTEGYKSTAALGNTNKSIEESTENFILELSGKTKQKEEKIKEILNRENNEFILFKSKTHIGLNNLRINNISLNDILTCLIRVIFRRYGVDQNNVDNIVTNIITNYGNENNFQFGKENTKNICGILHLIAYQKAQQFENLIVIDKISKDFKIINCAKIEHIFEDCKENVGFLSRNDKETNKDGNKKVGRKNSTYGIYYKN